MNIKRIVESFSKKRATGGVSEIKIAFAEKTLGLRFAPDYKELLKNYGSLFLNGEEFLGLDTVKVTEDARKEYSNFPQNVYVISKTYIDGVLLVQDEDGTVYAFQPRKRSQKVADSLIEYIKSL